MALVDLIALMMEMLRRENPVPNDPEAAATLSHVMNEVKETKQKPKIFFEMFHAKSTHTNLHRHATTYRALQLTHTHAHKCSHI